jgi:hypothetical protein
VRFEIVKDGFVEMVEWKGAWDSWMAVLLVG